MVVKILAPFRWADATKAEARGEMQVRGRQHLHSNPLILADFSAESGGKLSPAPHAITVIVYRRCGEKKNKEDIIIV